MISLMTPSSDVFISFRINGEPAPQGSKIPGRSPKTGKLFVREQNSAKQTSWRQDVIAAATRARHETGWETTESPLNVIIQLRMPRPASVSIKRRPYPNVKPDIDKIIRNTLDALTVAGIYRDDAQVITLFAEKLYATDDPQGSPGASVRVALVPPPMII